MVYKRTSLFIFCRSGHISSKANQNVHNTVCYRLRLCTKVYLFIIYFFQIEHFLDNAINSRGVAVVDIVVIESHSSEKGLKGVPYLFLFFIGKSRRPRWK